MFTPPDRLALPPQPGMPGQFAGQPQPAPIQQQFQIQTRQHAIAALRYVGPAQQSGQITPQAADQLRMQAHAMLAGQNSGYAGQLMNAAQQA
jgi:hypothetical protein